MRDEKKKFVKTLKAVPKCALNEKYSARMSSRPMGWSEEGAYAMCQLRCYVRDYGEEKVIDLVRCRREK